MNQEKIGKFISKIRKENNMTQQELADKLNVTDRAVSNWENGRRLPDYSLIKDLCSVLNISINELFLGEKIKDNEFKEKAEENLFKALENSSFSLREKIKFYKNKWKKDNLSYIVLSFIIWLIIIIVLYLKKVNYMIIIPLVVILAVIIYIYMYNKMMIYVENNAYKKIDK